MLTFCHIQTFVSKIDKKLGKNISPLIRTREYEEERGSETWGRYSGYVNFTKVFFRWQVCSPRRPP